MQMKNAKKKTETDETVGFFGTFLLLVKFQLRGGGFPGPPPFGYSYAPIEENKKVFANFSHGFLRFPTKFHRFKK